MKTREFDELKRQKLSPKRRKAVDASVRRKLVEMDLRALRQARGTTQAELARLAEMAQPEISRLERRDDCHISTLRRVVEALGGELQIVARFPGDDGDVRVRIG